MKGFRGFERIPRMCFEKDSADLSGFERITRI